MYIQQIEQTNFQSKTPKKRFITDTMKSGIESLLLRMNAETECVRKGDYFVSTITRKIKIDSDKSFEDERHLSKVVPFKEQMQGFSVLEFGKVRLDIDNQTGEIIDAKKPFYKPWFFILKQAENIINEFRASFVNKTEMEREKLKVQKMTPEAEKQIKKFVLQFEKQRLEDVTKKLEQELKE